MSTGTTKTNQKAFANNKLIEQLRDMGRGVGKTLVKDVAGGVATDALSSLFGVPKSGDIKPGEEINLGGAQPPLTEQKPIPQRPEFPFVRPLRHEFYSPINQEALNKIRAEEAQVAQKIEEVRQELRQLILALKEVDSEIRQAVDEHLVDPGIYHLNYLDRLKTMLKLLRQNLNQSASWLNVMKSKKKQKTYWAQYKKKGTSFGLNHERTVATQVG